MITYMTAKLNQAREKTKRWAKGENIEWPTYPGEWKIDKTIRHGKTRFYVSCFYCGGLILRTREVSNRGEGWRCADCKLRISRLNYEKNKKRS